MGIFGSSEESVEQKVVDTTGNVNNNIIIQEANDTHHQMLLSEKLLFGTYCLVGIELIKLSIYFFGAFKRHVKKRYQNNVVKSV